MTADDISSLACCMQAHIHHLPSARRDYITLSLLLVSCAILAMRYEEQLLWVFTRERTFYPDFVSGLVGMALVSTMVWQGLFYQKKLSVLHAVNLLLFVYMAAAFTTMGLGTTGFWAAPRTIISILTNPTVTVPLAFCILAVAMGKRWSLLPALALMFFATANLLQANAVMAELGFVLAVASGLAVLVAVDLSRAWRLLRHGGTEAPSSGPLEPTHDLRSPH